MQVFKAEVLYWKVADPRAFSPPHFPVFLVNMSPDSETTLYSTPVLEYPGMLKVGKKMVC